MGPRVMADVELLPLPEGERASDMYWDAQVYGRDEMHAYARANLAPLQAEIEALRAEVEESDAVVDKLARVLAETAIVIKGPEPDMTKWSYHDIPDGVRAIQARAERLAEALRGLLGVGDKFTGDPNEDAATWVAANDAARAALAQEDRNG